MIEKVVDACLEQLKERFGDSITIEDHYPLEERRVSKPVIYTECVGFDRTEAQPASGQLGIDANFETRISFPVTRKASERKKARKIACEVALLIENNNFGIDNCWPARIKSAYDDGLDPDVPTVESWSILWEMQVNLGEKAEESDLIIEKDPGMYDVRKEVKIERSPG